MALECCGISKLFGRLAALDDVTISFAPGEIHVVVGPNGSGKSTLLNVFSGQVRPDRGVVKLNGVEITRTRADERARDGVRRTFQDGRVARLLSIRENLVCAHSRGESLREMLAPTRRDISPDVSRFLRLFGLVERLDEQVGELSVGQQRLVSIALCLTDDAKVLLLDEPFAGLSASMIQVVRELLLERAALGNIVVVVEHDLEECRKLADRVVVMNSGRVVATGDDQILADPEQLLRLYAL